VALAPAVELYGAGLVFARVGSIAMLLPGVGESAVPPRVRLAFALVLSLAIYPIVRAGMPALPATVGDMVGHLLIELLVGLALGSLIRLFLSTLAVAGEVYSLQTTLSFAQTANPLQAQPGTTLAAFLTLLGVALVFSTDLHQMFVAAMVHSFSLFPPGKAIPVADFAQLEIRTVAQTFALGIQLAAPILVFSLIFNIAAGFVGRMMPQFQIFFVATPLSVLLGLSILGLGLGSFGLIWVDHFRSFLAQFV
jgi:flagellar biosynthetic protein FliR